MQIARLLGFTNASPDGTVDSFDFLAVTFAGERRPLSVGDGAYILRSSIKRSDRLARVRTIGRGRRSLVNLGISRPIRLFFLVVDLRLLAILS